MTSTDPISDMLARIRNAILVSKTNVVLPHSNIKESVAKILKSNNFIEDVAIDGDGIAKSLRITINQPGTNARITEIERLSKPGRRLYTPADRIPVVKRGRGIIIISTSKGLMTGNQAKIAKIGGELICQVY